MHRGGTVRRAGRAGDRVHENEAMSEETRNPESIEAEATDTPAPADETPAVGGADVAAAAHTAEAPDAGDGEAAGAEADATAEADAADTEPAGEAPAGEAPGLPMRWYVVHTYSGHENKVKRNLEKMIAASSIQDHFGQIVVPTEEVAEMRKGKKTITTRKFFPSYILVEMHMTDESWHLVNDMPGVTGFVGGQSGPVPLTQAEVDRILGRMDKEKQTIIPDIPFTLGEHIRIKDGPFSDFTGVIDEINPERGKLRVLVSIFGRETPVELDFLQVESIQ